MRARVQARGQAGEPSLALGDEQRRVAQTRTLERTLPQPVATATVGGGEDVEVDRARARPEQRGGDRAVDDRAGAVLAQGADSRHAGGARPDEVGEHQRAHLARADGARQRDARAGALQRAAQLLIGGAQSAGRAQRDDQHIDAQAWTFNGGLNRRIRRPARAAAL